MMNNRGKMSGRTFNKPKNRKHTLRRLWDYVVKFKWWLILALILTIATNMFSLFGPTLTGYAIGAIEPGKGAVNFNDVYKYSFLLIIFYALSSIFNYILSILMMNISKKIVYKLRKDCFDSLIKLPVSYFDQNQTGDIISKMSYDVDTINTSLSSDIIHICTAVITVVGSFIMMLTLSPLLILVFAITIPISLLFTRFMLKRTHKLFKARSESLGELNGYVEEMITGSKTISAYAQEDKILEEFDKANEYAVNNAFKAEFYGGITGPGVNFVNNLSLSLVCMFGSLLYIYNKLTLRQISSFVLYSRKFSGPINEVANIFTDIQSALAAAERVFGLIDATPELKDKDDAIHIENVNGEVEFKNVSFGYIPEKTIIHDLSFLASPGKQIAIVGPTGAGKTTIVNLLMRFYDINSGEILLDGNSIYNIYRKDLRLSYAMVLQDTWLFEGTVFDNIAYGKDNVTIEEVERVAKAAHIHGFIKRLPNGYNTVLSEDGINISKGQKQLLTIARAMLLDANMLILDEATSNVDTRTEVKIQEAMKTLMKDKTCFIIAHRLSTIKNADLILVVKDGNIIEQGTHKELLDKKGFYHELYNSQYQ